MSRVRRRVHISGLVQGVCFRAYARRAAQDIGVYGWVRNMPDGRVEAVFEGEKDQVAQMIEWCHRGSPFSRVDKVSVVEEIPTGEFRDFDIRYTG